MPLSRTRIPALAAAATMAILALPLGAVAARAQTAQPPASARPATAPPTMQPEQQRAAIARLGDMVGDWQGEGWIEQGNGRQTFRGGERVRYAIDGLAIVVEGRFTTRVPGASEEVPIHTTLGVISFDPRAERYRFNTWLASGASGEYPLELIDGGWRWFLDIPVGKVRYSTTFAGGEWHEVGEMQRGEGAPWRQFFEMRLKRVAKGGS